MDLTYDRLSGSLGSLLLLWARIEKSLRKEVVRAHGVLPPRAHGIAAVLRTWEESVIRAQSPTSLGPLLATTLRSQLQSLLDVRNGLCHGLDGISLAHEGRPAELRWELNSEQHSITWDELQSQFRWLSKLPYAISLISNPKTDRWVSRHTDITENRDWWRSEYGLIL